MYPKLIIKKNKLRDNLMSVKRILSEQGVDLSPVTKGFSAIPELVHMYDEVGVNYIADSRVQNFKKQGPLKAKRMLIRLPMLSEIDEVVEYTECCLISEIEIIRALDDAAKRQNKTYEIILMVEIGDLREGLLKENIIPTVKEILPLEHMRLMGLGINTNCYGGVIPSEESLQELVKLRKEVEEYFDISLPITSGGNSGIMYMAREIPEGITHLRLGETILFGTESSYAGKVDNLHYDVFSVQIELIEVQTKPSKPWGNIGPNAFGEMVSYEDKGLMKRGILACGRQDLPFEKLIPLDDIELLGTSSDHIIVDLKETDYKVGDILTFHFTYGALLGLTTSDYTTIEIVNE